MSNTDPLIKRHHANLVIGGLMALGGLLAYLIGVGVRLDDRLDRLEEDAKLLVGADGRIIPARESIEASLRVKELEREIDVLRQTLNGHRH